LKSGLRARLCGKILSSSPLSFGDILHRKEDQMWPAAPLFDSHGIKDQDPMTDRREIMLDPEILKRQCFG
jgi:hypothetical protein